jgi:hypothetical protein
MASAPEQIGLLELSVAATGKAFTVTVAVAVNGREQVPLLTLVRFKDVSAVTAVSNINSTCTNSCCSRCCTCIIYSISCRSSYSKIASAPEQIGLLELSVAATGKPLPLQLLL